MLLKQLFTIVPSLSSSSVVIRSNISKSAKYLTNNQKSCLSVPGKKLQPQLVRSSISLNLLQISNCHKRQFSTSIYKNDAKKPSTIEEKDTTPKEEEEEEKSWIRLIFEFIGELLEDLTTMLFWKFIIFVVPILFFVWFYFGSSGVTTAFALVWVFIVALFKVDPKDETKKNETK